MPGPCPLPVCGALTLVCGLITTLQAHGSMLSTHPIPDAQLDPLLLVWRLLRRPLHLPQHSRHLDHSAPIQGWDSGSTTCRRHTLLLRARDRQLLVLWVRDRQGLILLLRVLMLLVGRLLMLLVGRLLVVLVVLLVLRWRLVMPRLHNLQLHRCRMQAITYQLRNPGSWPVGTQADACTPPSQHTAHTGQPARCGTQTPPHLLVLIGSAAGGWHRLLLPLLWVLAAALPLGGRRTLLLLAGRGWPLRVAALLLLLLQWRWRQPLLALLLLPLILLLPRLPPIALLPALERACCLTMLQLICRLREECRENDNVSGHRCIQHATLLQRVQAAVGRHSQDQVQSATQAAQASLKACGGAHLPAFRPSWGRAAGPLAPPVPPPGPLGSQSRAASGVRAGG